MTTPARLIHQTRGRVRIAIPEKRGDNAFFAALADRMARHEGVLRARGNAAAASLVVEYTNRPEDVVRALERADLAIAPLPATVDDTGVTAASTTVANSVACSGGAGIAPMSVACAAFGVVGIVQALRGEIMIPALSAFWYAASAFRLAQIPPPTNARDGTEGGSDGGRAHARKAGAPIDQMNAISP